MLREKEQDSHLVANIPGEKPALLSGRDAQALHYLKVSADEKAYAVEEEISRNPQPTLQLGKLTQERCTTMLLERI